MPRNSKNKTSGDTNKEEKAKTTAPVGLKAKLAAVVSKRGWPLLILGAVIVLVALLTAGAYLYDRFYSKPAPQEQDTAPTSYLENVENANTVETLENDEDKAAFYASLAALSYSESDFSKALDYYLRSQELTKEPQGWLYLSIADVYEKQGDNQNALGYYQRALDYYESADAPEAYVEEKAYAEERIGQLQNAE